MEQGPKIRLGNGVEVIGEVSFYFDPVNIGHRGVHCLSHAHFDHLPMKILGNEVIGSAITILCARDRLKKDLRAVEHPQIKSLNSGHILGSSMFLLDGEQRVLYTGDLCTRDRLDILGAVPIKTDILILEATYGLPRYAFPPREDIERIVRDWVEDNLARGRSVALFAYSLGKSQEMLMLLRDMVPHLYGSSLYTTRLLEDAGLEFSYRPFDVRTVEEPFVLICPTGVRRAGFIESLRNHGLLTASVSGWALDPSFKHRMGADEVFPMSDHADFNELLWFAEKCEPSMVLTHHGFERDLAAHIKVNLGIESQALIKDQRSLLEF